MYSHVKIVYAIIWVLNIVVMLYSGVKMSKTKTDKAYWNCALPAIIMYMVFMGLRFGRLIDYNLYANTYAKIGLDFASDDHELLFKIICYAMNMVGLPYQAFILFCSFMIIFTALYFLKEYRPAMPYMLLAFLLEASMVENFVRWYLAVSFLLMYLYYLRRGKKVCFIFAVAAVMVHVGMLFLVFAFFFINKVKIVPFPPIVWQGLLIASEFFGSRMIFAFLAPYVGLLGIDERSAGYADQFVDIINGDFGGMGVISRRSIFTSIRITLGYSFPIYMISYLVKEKIIRPIDANSYLIGIVLSPICDQVEILGRFSGVFTLFATIVSGSAFYYYFKRRRLFKSFYFPFAVLSLFSFVWPLISGVTYRDDWWQMLFIWDAHGRDYLPVDYFKK